MWGLINLIDKNKEKLIEKFKIEKKETMKCPNCSKEYENLSLHFCKNCNTSLSKETKYKIPKELKKKILYPIIGIVLIVSVGVSGYIGISNIIQEQQRLEKYNNDLTVCYETIKNDSNWSNFKTTVNNHNEESDFEPKAYEKLYQAIDERIDNVKNGNEDNELITMLNEIMKNNSDIGVQVKIESRYLKANSYSNLNTINREIEEQKYIEAYDLLGTVITDNTNKNPDIVKLATNKQNEIKDKAFEQVITQAQEKMNSQDYSSVKTMLSKYKDLGNQTILDMYNNATNELNRIEAEKKAQEEAERIAKEKAEEEKRAMEEAEEKARKKSQGVSIGMSKQDVLDSNWGKPDHINTTTTRYGVHEQWVYGGGNYLYFENGILTSIQN